MKQAIELILSVAFACAMGLQVHAQTSGPSPIVVEHPWARATPGGAKTGATYLTLINNGDSADQLLGATTPVADKVQFHSTSEENGVSHMREMHAIDLSPRASSEALKTKTGRLKEKIEKLKEQMRRLEISQSANARHTGPADLADRSRCPLDGD